jgi:hypothetical protein
MRPVGASPAAYLRIGLSAPDSTNLVRALPVSSESHVAYPTYGSPLLEDRYAPVNPGLQTFPRLRWTRCRGPARVATIPVTPSRPGLQQYITFPLKLSAHPADTCTVNQEGGHMLIHITYADGSQGLLREDDNFFCRECVMELEARDDVVSVTVTS